MAYPHPIVRYRENNRYIIRGATLDEQRGRFVFQQREDETLKAVLDFTDLLNGSTITASSTDENITASTSVSSGQITLTTSAIGNSYGDVDLTVTFSDGRVRVEKLRFQEPNGTWREDYGWISA